MKYSDLDVTDVLDPMTKLGLALPLSPPPPPAGRVRTSLYGGVNTCYDPTRLGQTGDEPTDASIRCKLERREVNSISYRRYKPLTLTIAIWVHSVQLQSLMCQTGLSRHL